MDDNKEFDAWNKVKKRLQKRTSLPLFKEGEVWWFAAGKNISTEIKGKGKSFSRPVLILRKLSATCFMGVPLTSKQHEGTWYVCFVFQGKVEVANLAQARTMSPFRLYNKLGRVSESDFRLVQDGFNALYCK